MHSGPTLEPDGRMRRSGSCIYRVDSPRSKDLRQLHQLTALSVYMANELAHLKLG